MGQKFLEKALLSLKRAMRRANPRCREKMIQNLLINEMVRGQAQRNWITLHINNAADVEPCVFCQLSTDNLHEKSLLETLRTSPLLASIRKRQPYSDNYLRPCMIIDNPEVLKEVIEEAKPRETCRGGAFRLISDLRPNLLTYASRWKDLSDPVWQEKYAALYRKPILDAHALSESHAREHPVSAAGG